MLSSRCCRQSGLTRRKTYGPGETHPGHIAIATTSSTEPTFPIWTSSSVIGRANARERHGREFESHQVRRVSYGYSHTADNAASSVFASFNMNNDFRTVKCHYDLTCLNDVFDILFIRLVFIKICISYLYTESLFGIIRQAGLVRLKTDQIIVHQGEVGSW